MGRKMIRQSLAERKMMASIKSLVDVKLNAFGLKIKRLEYEIRAIRAENIQLKKLIKGDSQ